MASKATREAMGLGVLGEFAKAFVQGRKEKRAEARDEERFLRELAARQLELDRAEEFKRANFELDRQKAISSLAGMGAQTTVTDPATGKQYFQAPKMQPEDVKSIQEKVLGISLPGVTPPTAPLIQQRLPMAAASLPGMGPQPTETPVSDAGSYPPRPGVGVGAPKEGKGAGAPEAKGRVTDLLKELEMQYKQLDELGAIVSTERGKAENVAASASASGPGQFVGKVTGSQPQAIRNKIAQMKPLLVQEIRKATEMGARGLDSEKELAFYLQAATDPTVDIGTNLNALRILDNAYGLGGQFGGQKAPAAPKETPEQRKARLIKELKEAK